MILALYGHFLYLSEEPTNHSPHPLALPCDLACECECHQNSHSVICSDAADINGESRELIFKKTKNKKQNRVELVST